MSIVNSLTISGFKVFGTAPDGSVDINNSIAESGIYGYIDNALTLTSPSPQTVYLTNNVVSTKRGASKTVDTLSVMVNTATPGDTVVINGYTAIAGTAAGTTDYDFYAPQGSTGSLLTYTIAASGSGKKVTAIAVTNDYTSANAINVREGNNVLIIEIFNGTAKRVTYTYNVVIVSSSTRLASLNPNLSVFQYSPVFNNSNYSPDVTQNYILSVPLSATEMTLTPVAVASTQEITIVIKKPNGDALQPVVSGQASSSFTFVDNNSVEATVTAADGETTQKYTISIQNDAGNNTLKTVALSYIPVSGSNVVFQDIATAWSSGNIPNATVNTLATIDSYRYLYCIPYDSRGIYLSVVSLDAFSTVTVGGVTSLEEGNFLIPYSSLIQGSANTITCVCTSSMGYSRPYTFTIWLAGEDNANLSIFSGSLNNISCVDGAAIINPATPFNPATFLTRSDAIGISGVTIATTDLPVYTVYVAATTGSTTSVTINLNYNDDGSRFTVLQKTSAAAGTWSPATDLNTVPTSPVTTISGDNWVLGSQRSVTLTGVPLGTLTADNTNSVVIASHLPNGLYYLYGLRFVTPAAALNSLRLFNSTTGSQYSLNPTFSSIVESYTVYVGTVATPATTMDVNLLVGSAYKVDYTYVFGDSYTASKQIVSAVSTNVPVLTTGPLYIRIYDTSTTTLQGYYSITLLNVDASLLLDTLTLYPQAAINPDGTWPTPGAALTLVPNISPNLGTVFVYNAGNPQTWCKLVPTTLNPTVKTITVSIGTVSQIVPSGTTYYFQMTSDTVLVNINVRDNLNPNNSNDYSVFVYSTSNKRELKLASFSGIPNGSFSPTPLPDGVLYTTPIAPSASSSTPVTYSCANALVTSTQFTATPLQAGTSMYIVQGNGFTPLLPGVASSSIALNTAQTNTKVWMYANNNTDYGIFDFQINRIPSSNNNLSSMNIANVSGFTFSPAVTDYTGINVIPPKTTTTFRAISENVNSVIQWSINGSAYVTIASGVLSSTININPIVNNALSLKVTAESGAIKFYTFNITRPYNSYLTELKIFNNVSTALAATTLTESAVTINPSPFNATFFTYSAEVASNIEVAYAVLYHSSESVITMNNGSLYGLTTDGTGEVWAVPVQLSSVNPLVYQINPSNIVVSAGSSSNTYNLAVIRERSTAVAQSIQLYDSSNNLVPLRNSVGVSVPFDQFTFTYTIDAALYSGQTLRVELVGQGANIYLVNGIQYFVPVSYEINASYPIIVKAQSTISSNVYSLYQFSLL